MVKPVPRVRKARVRARLAEEHRRQVAQESDSATHAREAVKQHLQSQNKSTKLTGQKRKRLEKYLDTKLKRDENQDLIKKLSEQTIDTSLLKSSKKLGRVSQTRKEALAHALRSQRAGFTDSDANDLIFQPRNIPDHHDFGATIRTDDRTERKTVPSMDQDESVLEAAPKEANFGSGLKRQLEIDDSGMPIIQSRKRVKRSFTRSAKTPLEIDDDWEGFSSEDENGALTASDGLDAQDSAGDRADQSLRGSGSEEPDDDDGETSHSEDDSLAEESDSESSEDGEGHANDGDGSERVSNFKAWALSLRNEASGHQPTSAPDLMSKKPSNYPSVINRPQQPRLPDLSKSASQRPGRHAFHVAVVRSSELDELRAALPVVAKEQEIMETIFSHDCSIVTGATGSGKTTQVPQFLFEAGFGSPDGPSPGMIGITQPRRVAAVSMAKRVASELGDHGARVSHQIRFDSTVSSQTALKFMTDGVLLREVALDFLLTKYSAIVVDEAHERSVNTDILVGMLSRIVEMRRKLSSQESSQVKPLKLIIMSATLRVADFANNSSLFRSGPPPIVEAEGKAYPVITHFARRTHREYVEDAFRKVAKGHRKLPPGGMLVFLTGQSEIIEMERKLKEEFESTESVSEKRPKMRISATETALETEDMDFGSGKTLAAVDDEGPADGEELDFEVEPQEVRVLQKVHVLPLYSQLSSEQQMRVFEPPPENARTIVLATNVAETSLTIPGIRYVFDCGRAKEKTFDANTRVQSFDVDWISKASAEQRRGRAGRTGPGHCYRLYSSAVYENHFADHTTPEILRVPIESVVLQLKSMGIPNIAAFPFPTPPERAALVKAQRLLENLKAIKDDTVTDIGRQLSYYPISPRLARVLVSAINSKVLEHTIALVAVMSADEVFVPHSRFQLGPDLPDQADTSQSLAKEKRRQAYAAFHAHASRLDKHSDALKLLTSFCDFTADPTSDKLQTFTYPKRLHEAQQLRGQLTRLIGTHTRKTVHAPTPLPVPSPAHTKTLTHLLATGFIDQLAQRADACPAPPPPGGRTPTNASHVPYLPLTPLQHQRTTDSPDDAERARSVFIHPGSSLAHLRADKAPRFLLYTHLSRAAPATVGSGDIPRTRLHPLAAVEPEVIAALARGTPLLGESKPIGKPEPMPRSAELEERRRVWVTPFLRAGNGAEWPLPPPRKVVQVRVRGKGWVEEEEETRAVK